MYMLTLFQLSIFKLTREKFIITFLSLLLLSGCSTWTQALHSSNFEKKVHIERLSGLNPEGLYGPPDGLVSLSYEFCIPGDIKHVEEVMAVDPTVVVYQHSPGRIGCSKNQYLCIGSTSQLNYRQTLEKLADKPFIHSIKETYFE